MKYLILLAIMVFTPACEPKNSGSPPPKAGSGDNTSETRQPTPTPREVDGEFSGYNANGEEGSCKEMAPGTICTQVFTDEDKFGADCNKGGYKSIQCACHKWLCEVPAEEFTCGTAKQLKCKSGYKCEFERPQDSASPGVCVPAR